MTAQRLSLTQRPWLAAKISWSEPGAAGAPWPRALLASRGIVGAAEQADYLAPSMQSLGDPAAMADMAAATGRLARALRGAEPICVYGDYDVDGVCSAALVAEALRALGGEVRVYIPQRRAEGYGLNPTAVEALARQVRLIVSVDCGVTAHREVARAGELGCDVVVVDHHQTPAALPPAAAVLDPHRPDCGYPFKGLCAAGVAFLLIVALRRRLREEGAFAGRAEPDLRPLLDLVALATVADMVPMQGTNRVLVAAGLRRMRRWPRPGLVALAAVAGVDLAAVTTSDLGYRLGPRINARGRMNDAAMAVDLMLTSRPEAAAGMAQALEEANRQRREVERQTLAAAEEQVRQRRWQHDAAMVVADPSWHPGVLGLVAGRLAQRHGVATVVIGEGGRGSARSAAGLDVHAALAAASPYLRGFGGHRAAAGCQVEWAQVDRLREAFAAAAAGALGPPPYPRAVAPDVAIAAHGLTLATAHEAAALQPFGQANPEPLFVAEGLAVAGRRRMGSEHFKLELAGGCEAVAFQLGHLADQVGDRVDLAFHLEPNRWRGSERAQARVVDVRAAAS